MRSIACPTWSGSVIAPCRYSSAYPRMVTSGVRSSWEASDTNCRMRFSDCLRPSKESSMWPSIVLSAAESLPSSVFDGYVDTRWERSPAAIFDAVFSMSCSGRKVFVIAK